MNLYKVERTDSIDYDEYDSAVIAAESEDEARSTPPAKYSTWSAPIESLQITLIGVAKEGTFPGVIVSSFNAG